MCCHGACANTSIKILYLLRGCIKMSSSLPLLKKTDRLHAGSCNAQREELVGLFPVDFAECSFGVKQSVSKVWAGD